MATFNIQLQLVHYYERDLQIEADSLEAAQEQAQSMAKGNDYSYENDYIFTDYEVEVMAVEPAAASEVTDAHE